MSVDGAALCVLKSWVVAALTWLEYLFYKWTCYMHSCNSTYWTGFHWDSFFPPPSFPWFLSGKSVVMWWDKWEYWHCRVLVSNSSRSKLLGPSFFLLKWSLKLIFKACFLKLEQGWVSLFKLKFWSIKMFLILVGISLIFVWQSPGWFSSKFMDEMQLREGNKNSRFSRTKKMVSLVLVPVSLFPWWWLLVEGPALKL